MNYCSECAAKVSLEIPENDERHRFVCTACQHIHYQNPRVITGCLPIWKDQVLLCKRAIEPRSGLWTLPAGFMENGESLEQGAQRETKEEANALVDNLSLYSVTSLPEINQVYLLYLAYLTEPRFSSGIESLEVQLFNEADIPWQTLAFPIVEKTLRAYFKERLSQQFSVHQWTIFKDNI